MTVVLWNRLPPDLVSLGDLDSFKREVSKIRSESELLLVIKPNDNHSPEPVIRSFQSLALAREVNLATESSAPSAADRRESVSEFQSLIVCGKKLLL